MGSPGCYPGHPLLNSRGHTTTDCKTSSLSPGDEAALVLGSGSLSVWGSRVSSSSCLTKTRSWGPLPCSLLETWWPCLQCTFIFIIALLRNNPYTIHPLKSVQFNGFQSIHRVQLSPRSNFRIFQPPLKETLDALTIAAHSPLPLTVTGRLPLWIGLFRLFHINGIIQCSVVFLWLASFT